jgi:predicted AlkP superfamily phosphohydrolase/phosphomutase
MVDFPDEKNLGDFLSNARELTERLADASLKIYKDYQSDLFFLTFLTLDRIKHFIWRFTDKEDIYYPGESAYENAIKNFYVLIDKTVGDYMDFIDNDTCLMVISDHGHRRRCQQ